MCRCSPRSTQPDRYEIYTTTLQKRLLQKAVALLKPGGTLVYCTCSLEPEEGEQAIDVIVVDMTHH